MVTPGPSHGKVGYAGPRVPSYRPSMRRMPNPLALCALLLAACSHESSGTPRVEEPSSRAARTCTPAGAESAHPLPIVSLAVGCSFRTGGSESAPLVVHDAEAFASAVQCTGATMPRIDFSANDVYLVTYSMSPATTGVAPLDDGTTVTFATRFRRPCPGDPLPMPMNATFGFLLPKNATRTYRSANCTLPLDCP